MLMTVQNGNRGEICMQYIGMQKQIISIWKIIIKTLNYHALCIDSNNLYGWSMFQQLPANEFKWKEMYLNSMNKLWWR